MELKFSIDVPTVAGYQLLIELYGIEIALRELLFFTS